MKAERQQLVKYIYTELATIKIFTDSEAAHEEKTGGRVKLSALKRKVSFYLKKLSKNYQVRKSMTDGEIVVFSKHPDNFFSSVIIKRVIEYAEDSGYMCYMAARERGGFHKTALIIYS